MSGPYDRPDDPDEVTLWSGRLRAWPTPPEASDDGEPDDDTAVSARAAAADDPVGVEREAPADDTVGVEREAPADDTVRVERRPAADTARDAPDDDTERAARDRPTSASVDAHDLDETTSPGRRRAAVAPDRGVDAPDAQSETGDTAAGTRRARSRLRSTTPEIPSGDPVPTPREARVPTADHELYRPRADGAIRVTRSAPPPRPADAPDAAEARPRSPRRARRRGVALALTVVVLVATAAIALFLLMG